ncbi:ABC transporter ATP-binding protein [Gordonia sp. MP11Mi]|uniref:ABC transporter ATP-binding protein n=1 Tax=Gordonia sp. MP11Mi TaxID=3022769 RepID=A0AA97CUK8_9ACTN
MISPATDVRHAAVGPLRPIEIASIAIFSGLTVVPAVIVAVVPMAAALGFLAPVPIALLAARTRSRAVIAAFVTTVAVTFAVAGLGTAVGVAATAVVGGIVGEVRRRGGGAAVLTLVAVIAAPLIAGLTVALMWLLAPLRRLGLEVFDNVLTGLAKTVRAVRLDAVGDAIENFSGNVVDHWWLWIWIPGTIGTFVTILVAGWMLGKVLDRLADVKLDDTLEGAYLVDDVVPGPLPMRAVGVGYRYPGTSNDVLTGIDLELHPGEFVAVVGANGSGKSTLAKILAGVEPTIGIVDRPGAPGLGRAGGTALVLQRPEAQMLGSRVADDLVWGLPDDATVDIDGLLAEVGLAGLGDRDTSDLSGGQQQRLAVAAALARGPRLVIADEVTSMVDPQGRHDLISILAELPRRHGITVVLITHRDSEARAADRIVHLADGRVVAHHPEWMRPENTAPALTSKPFGGSPLLVVDSVAHTYLQGSPWEVTALHRVSLRVDRGDGVLIVGGNGSGKSTLAWILAGLTEPTSGQVLLGGEPVRENVGRVGLGFQHARLQLQKVSVGDEIMAVGGENVGTTEVGRVLDLVSLPREFAAKRVDSLSGGQMRRVVLASLIASDPDVLVLDEPLAGLDPQAREEVLNVLAALREQHGSTIVIISHDLESLDRVCNRRVELVAGVLEGGA